MLGSRPEVQSLYYVEQTPLATRVLRCAAKTTICVCAVSLCAVPVGYYLFLNSLSYVQMFVTNEDMLPYRVPPPPEFTNASQFDAYERWRNNNIPRILAAIIFVQDKYSERDCDTPPKTQDLYRKEARSQAGAHLHYIFSAFTGYKAVTTSNLVNLAIVILQIERRIFSFYYLRDEVDVESERVEVHNDDEMERKGEGKNVGG